MEVMQLAACRKAVLGLAEIALFGSAAAVKSAGDCVLFMFFGRRDVKRSLRSRWKLISMQFDDG